MEIGGRAAMKSKMEFYVFFNACVSLVLFGIYSLRNWGWYMAWWAGPLLLGLLLFITLLNLVYYWQFYQNLIFFLKIFPAGLQECIGATRKNKTDRFFLTLFTPSLLTLINLIFLVLIIDSYQPICGVCG